MPVTIGRTRRQGGLATSTSNSAHTIMHLVLSINLGLLSVAVCEVPTCRRWFSIVARIATSSRYEDM